MHDYTDRSEKTTKRLMVPVGLSNGEPIWDDGTTIVAREGSKDAISWGRYDLTISSEFDSDDQWIYNNL